MSFCLGSTVVTHRIAYAHIDRGGRLYCTECLEAPEVTPYHTWTLDKPFADGGSDEDGENLCERCRRNPWHCAKEVQSTTTVEFVSCKIFLKILYARSAIFNL